MELHPITVAIGIIVLIIMLVVVGLGMSCGLYINFPDTYPQLQQFHDLAKSGKLC